MNIIMKNNIMKKHCEKNATHITWARAKSDAA